MLFASIMFAVVHTGAIDSSKTANKGATAISRLILSHPSPSDIIVPLGILM
jgi:hypothetical protein